MSSINNGYNKKCVNYPTLFGKIDVIITGILLIVTVRGVVNAIDVFNWSYIDREMHAYGAVPVLYIFTIVSINHILEWIQLRINRCIRYGVIYACKVILILSGLSFGISATNYNWVDLVP